MPEPPVVSGLTVHDLHFFVNQLLGTNPRTLFTFQFGSRIIPVLSGQDLRKSPASPSSINQPITPLRSLSCLSHWLSGFTWELGFFFFMLPVAPLLWGQVFWCFFTATQQALHQSWGVTGSRETLLSWRQICGYWR